MKLPAAATGRHRGADSVLPFGAAAYLDADGIVVGALVTGGNEGAVFLFTAAGTDWALDQRIVAPDWSIRFSS